MRVRPAPASPFYPKLGMTTGLVSEALRKALTTKCPGPGLLHHSDHGSQYCAQDYQEQLRRFGLAPSMSC
jgi:putative transposase